MCSADDDPTTYDREYRPMDRQLSMRLDGLCDICCYPVTDGECRNPVCGGTDKAAAAFAAASVARAERESQEAERQRLYGLSFQP